MRSLTMADFMQKPGTVRPLDTRRHQHTRDGLPGWGTRPVTHPVIPREPIRLTDDDAVTQYLRDRHMFQVRVHPERFEPADVELAHVAREREVPDGHWDWDCTRCQASVITKIGERCARCGCA